jgi:hypothetical protein
VADADLGLARDHDGRARRDRRIVANPTIGRALNASLADLHTRAGDLAHERVLGIQAAPGRTAGTVETADVSFTG